MGFFLRQVNKWYTSTMQFYPYFMVGMPEPSVDMGMLIVLPHPPCLPISLPPAWRWCWGWCWSAACRRWNGGWPCRWVRCCFNDSYYIHNTRTQLYPYFPISLSPYLRPDDDVENGVDLLHAISELEDDHVGQWGAVSVVKVGHLLTTQLVQRKHGHWLVSPGVHHSPVERAWM